MKPSSSYWSWRDGLPPLDFAAEGGGCLGFATGEDCNFEALTGVAAFGVLATDFVFCLFFLLKIFLIEYSMC